MSSIIQKQNLKNKNKSSCAVWCPYHPIACAKCSLSKSQIQLFKQFKMSNSKTP